MFTSNSFVLNPILVFLVIDSSRKEIVAGATATFFFLIKKHKGGSYCSILGKSYSFLLLLLMLLYLVYNCGREYCFVFNCAIMH